MEKPLKGRRFMYDLRVRQNFLGNGRLTSCAPLPPPPPIPTGSPTDRPNRYRDRVEGWSVGAPEGEGGGGGEESSSISHMLL